MLDVSKQEISMADPITPQVSDRICKHMNEDHADAVALYARVYGDTPAATQAEMQSIDPEGMTLMVQVDGTATPVRIQFDHVLQDSEDAHQTLIAMVKQARQQPQK
jgi:putative heme iron utilization protein